MLKKRILAALAAIAVVPLTPCVFGAGFALYETSPRGIAMGGAVMGQFGDASAIYANPAVMTDSGESSLLAGISLINPGMDCVVRTPQGAHTYSPDDQWFPPTFFYFTKKLTDDIWLGISEYTPFGLGIRHATDWPGRFSSVETKISTVALNPNVAWRINERLSVAAGINVMYFDIFLSRNLPGIDKLLEINGDGFGVGANAAVAWKLGDNTGLGLVYRSEIMEPLSGEAKIAAIRHQVDVTEDLTLPQSISLGLNHSGIKNWNFGVIATWTDWRSYDNLSLAFEPALLGRIPASKSEKHWKATWRFGTGAEYQFSDYAAIQFGYVFDQDPINLTYGDYLLPAGDRHIASIGLRTKLSEKWDLHLAFAKIFIRHTTLNARPDDGVFNTRYKDGDAKIISCGLSRKF